MTMKVLPPENVRAIVVHCTATALDDHNIIDKVRQIHVQENGWDAIGYHYIIDRAGRLLAARPLMFQGAHAMQANPYSLGVALEGGIDAQGAPQANYTQAQMTTLFQVIAELRRQFPTILEVFGHNDMERDAGFKACPCFNVRQWYGETMRDAHERMMRRHEQLATPS